MADAIEATPAASLNEPVEVEASQTVVPQVEKVPEMDENLRKVLGLHQGQTVTSAAYKAAERAAEKAVKTALTSVEDRLTQLMKKYEEPAPKKEDKDPLVKKLVDDVQNMKMRAETAEATATEEKKMNLLSQALAGKVDPDVLNAAVSAFKHGEAGASKAVLYEGKLYVQNGDELMPFEAHRDEWLRANSWVSPKSPVAKGVGGRASSLQSGPPRAQVGRTLNKQDWEKIAKEIPDDDYEEEEVLRVAQDFNTKNKAGLRKL